MPTFRSLECFVVVVDSGSVTEAARRLFVSQPALSHQLSVLENEIGTRLLDRLPRGVRPTAAGRAMYEAAKIAVAAAERAVVDGQRVALGQAGVLRVGCAETLTGPVLAPLVRSWTQDHPDAVIEIMELSSADALQTRVESAEIDVAFCPRPSEMTGRIDVLGLEEFVLVRDGVRHGRGSNPLDWAALASRKIIHYTSDNGLRAWLDETAAQAGVVLQPGIRTRHASSAAELAAAGLGTAVVPRSAITPGFPGDIDSFKPPVNREIVALSRNSREPLVSTFLTHAIDVCRDLELFQPEQDAS